MRLSLVSLLILLLSVPALILGASKKKGKASGDSAPELISQGTAPSWKNTKELKALAAKGDPEACFELGWRLLDGDEELAADPAQARVLLEKAAAGGVANALFRLGKIYHDARGVPRDYAKALEYYTVAARRGVPEAQHNIGAMLVSARGVKRDYVEGLAWLLLAEQTGAASDAPRQVRERLAKRPADIQAAETRAKELSADLPNASVRTGAAPPPVITPPSAPPSAPVVALPPTAPTIAVPKIDPVAPPALELPAPPPPSVTP